MMRKSVCLVAVATAIFASPSNATPITWGFEGVTAGPGLPGGVCLPQGCQDIFEGTHFVGKFTFDLSAPDSNPDPDKGQYFSGGGPYGLWIDIGPYRYESHSVRVAVDTSGSINQYSIFSNEANGPFTRIGLYNCYERFALGSSDATR